MSLDLVLNELSLTPAPIATTEAVARSLMATFIDTLLATRRLGVNRTLLTNGNINYVELAPSYLLARWRNDPQVDEVARRFFTALITRHPYIGSLGDPDKENAFQLREARHNGRKADGLLCALILQTLSVSLPSHQEWNTPRLRISVEWLDEDGEIVQDYDEVVHASSRAHVEQNRNWIEERQRAGVADGQELWERRRSLFPSLDFCDSVAQNLSALRTSGDLGDLFMQILKKLAQLETYCQQWTEGPFDKDRIPFKVTPESESTLKNPDYHRQRTIVCPDGESRVFNLHARLTPLNWRLFFVPVESSRRLIIGYIGKKLPTVKYPT